MKTKNTKKIEPKVEWSRLIEGYRFLKIRNWDDYQVLTPSGVPAQWYKRFANAPFDEPMSLFVSGLLERLRDFRARLGSNIPTSMQTILSGCAVVGQDRHNVVAAMVQLVGSGRLVPTNEQHALSKKSIEEYSREEKRTKLENEHIWTTEPPASTDGSECCMNCGISRSISFGQPCEGDR